MSDKPILFSGQMVRALLAGTKTQTRLALSTKPSHKVKLFDGTWSDSYVLDPGNQTWRDQLCRYATGDRLYVREHWRTVGMGSAFDGVPPRDFQPQEVWYVADGEAPGNEFAGKFRQGMHMPRWASRLTLTVTDVRVERLQDCSEADALSEGVVEFFRGPDRLGWPAASADDVVAAASEAGIDGPVSMYRDLWNSISGAGAWEANPWVAAYSFTVERGNIDQLAGAA